MGHPGAHPERGHGGVDEGQAAEPVGVNDAVRVLGIASRAGWSLGGNDPYPGHVEALQDTHTAATSPNPLCCVRIPLPDYVPASLDAISSALPRYCDTIRDLPSTRADSTR
jgi:hypothetical protein